MRAKMLESYDKPRQHIKKPRHYFADKGSSSQSYGISSSHVWMGELGHKESRMPKNWCFWTVMSEKTLDCKEIKSVNPKGNQSWISIGRTHAEAPILWPPAVKSHSLEKTLVFGRLKAGGEGGDRGWDGWMASPTQWTWLWVSSRSWWWTGKHGVLQSMGSQRVRHNWATELNGDGNHHVWGFEFLIWDQSPGRNHIHYFNRENTENC